MLKFPKQLISTILLAIGVIIIIVSSFTGYLSSNTLPEYWTVVILCNFIASVFIIIFVLLLPKEEPNTQAIKGESGGRIDEEPNQQVEEKVKI